MSQEALIHLHETKAIVVTVAEYEELERELLARSLVDDVTIVEKVCWQLIKDHKSRYLEAKQINKTS